MAQFFQSVASLESLFADLIASITGLTPSKVLIGYEDEGIPNVSKQTDVCFLSVSIGTGGAVRGRQKTFVPATNTSQSKFVYSQRSERIVKLSVTFYGPNCFENAVALNQKLYFDYNKLTLEKNHLGLIPDNTIGPTTLRENHNGQWFKRCDLELDFYNMLVVEDIVGVFDEIVIRKVDETDELAY